MERRQVLLATSSSLAAAIAGCSSDESGNQTPTSDSGTDTATLLEGAAEDIQNANEALGSEADKFSDPSLDSGQGVDVQTATTVGYLDDASAKLDDAEQGATDSQQETISAAKSWVSYSRELVDFLDLFADGYSEFMTASTYFDSERYGDAADSLETAGETFGEADSQLTLVQDRQENLTGTDSEAFDDVSLSSTAADIEQMSELLAALIPFADGFRQMSLGFEDFLAATESLENENLIEAESTYNDAKEHFTSAESTLQGIEDSAPNSVRSSVIEAACYATALKEGADHYATGSGYYADGNTQAGDEEFTDGQNALERCNFNN